MKDAVPPLAVSIGAVGVDDAGELLTLQRASYVTEAQLYGDPELPALTQTLEELVAELETAIALKATVGHRIVGAVRAVVTEDVLHISRLTVAPDWQGQGIGSRLLAAIESSPGTEVGTAALFTGHLSAANLTMYAHRGYRQQRREQLRPGVILVHLAKPLTAAAEPQ